ncbi:MAG: hypothetical protein H6988_02980 [Pseudomonadales bacterium]|nr:hypothetical protein [Pseudomonadales bacterium]
MLLKQEIYIWTIRIILASFAAFSMAYASVYLEFKVLIEFVANEKPNLSGIDVRWELILRSLPSIAIFGLAGAILARLLKLHEVMILSFIVGSFGAIFRWSMITIVFSPNTSLFDRLYAHSQNLVPLASVMLVAFLSRHLRYLREYYS